MWAKRGFYLMALVAFFAFSVSAFGGGSSAHSQEGVMMSGAGHGGGMGGHGGMGGRGMTGRSRGLSALWEVLSQKLEKRNADNPYPKAETEALRERIREKRQELSDLVRSDDPDKKQIDKKIDELNRLESELDQKMSAFRR